MMARVTRWLDSAAVTRAVQVIAILSLVLAGVVGVRQYALASCLAEYNNAQAAANNARVQAAEGERAADSRLWSEIGEGMRTSDGPRIRRAIEDRNAARVNADRQRRENPLPSPPSQRC